MSRQQRTATRLASRQADAFEPHTRRRSVDGWRSIAKTRARMPMPTVVCLRDVPVRNAMILALDRVMQTAREETLLNTDRDERLLNTDRVNNGTDS